MWPRKVAKLGLYKRQNKACLHIPFKDFLDVNSIVARHDISHGGQLYVKIPENASGALPLHMLADQGEYNNTFKSSPIELSLSLCPEVLKGQLERWCYKSKWYGFSISLLMLPETAYSCNNQAIHLEVWAAWSALDTVECKEINMSNSQISGPHSGQGNAVNSYWLAAFSWNPPRDIGSSWSSFRVVGMEPF